MRADWSPPPSASPQQGILVVLDLCIVIHNATDRSTADDGVLGERARLVREDVVDLAEVVRKDEVARQSGSVILLVAHLPIDESRLRRAHNLDVNVERYGREVLETVQSSDLTSERRGEANVHDKQDGDGPGGSSDAPHDHA